MWTEIETICFSRAKIVKECLINVQGGKIMKKQFTSHHYIY